MMNNNTMHAGDCKCFSWKPIFAGALVAVGLSFLLNLFSVATGLHAFTADKQGIETLALGGLVGAAIGVLASMFAAGWLTGYLAQRHCAKRHLGALYGFLAWCVALIFAVFFASHAKDYVSFYGHFISSAEEVVKVSNPATGKTVLAVAEPVKSIIVSAYILFILFFLGAFAASIGGHCGMRHVCKNEGTC